MTITTTARVVRATGNGVTTDIPVPFQFYTLKVYVDGDEQVNGFDYNLSGGAGDTGTVTFVVAPDSGAKIVVLGDSSDAQGIDIQNFDDAPADVTEGALDLRAMRTLEAIERLGRTVRAPLYGEDLPELDFAGNPNCLLATDDDGVPYLAQGIPDATILDTPELLRSYIGYPAYSTIADAITALQAADVALLAADVTLQANIDAEASTRAAADTALAACDYLVKTASSTLAAERVVTDTATVAWDWATAGQAKANVPNDSITYAKIQNVTATNRILGRITSGAGDVEELTAANVMTILGLPFVSDVQSTGRFGIDDSGGLFVYEVVTATSPPQGIATRSQGYFNYSGGTPGFVSSTHYVLTDVAAGVTDFVWGLLSVLNNDATAGENVAGYFQAKKRATGDTWASVHEARDTTETANPTGALYGQEVDVVANGTDSGNTRRGVEIVFFRHNTSGADAEFAYGFRAGPSITDDGHVKIKKGFSLHGSPVSGVAPYVYGFDFSETTYSGGAIKLGDDQGLIPDTSGNFSFVYDSVLGTVELKRNTAAGNAANSVLSLLHSANGTFAAGMGTALLFRGETADGNIENGAQIAAVWTDLTSTAECADLRFLVQDAGAALAERWRIDNKGRFVYGGNAAQFADGGSLKPIIQVHGLATDDTQLSAAFYKWSNDANGNQLVFVKSRGTSVGTHAIVQDGDNVGNINFRASDGASFTNTAVIRSKVDGTPGTSDMPGRLEFLTTPDGSGTVVERWRIDNAGRLISGATASRVGMSSIEPQIQNHGTTDATSRQGLYRWSNDANAAQLSFLKSRSGTIGTHTVVQSGDVIGALAWGGSDGTAFIPLAQISAAVDATPGTNDMPGRIVFSTTADGASSLTERFRIDNAGRLVAGAVAAQTLNAAGTVLPAFQLNGLTTDNVNASFTAWTSGITPQLILAKSRNGTIGSHTAVIADELMGQLIGRGSDGTVFQDAAAIRFIVDGTPGSADMPGRIVFLTAPDGSATLTERWRIDNAGQFRNGGVTSLETSGATLIQISRDDFSQMVVSAHHSSGNPASVGMRSRGTLASPSVVSDGDFLWSFFGKGYDGSAYQNAAGIRFLVDGTPGSGDMPGRIGFYTTADGSTSLVERTRITQGGIMVHGGAGVIPTINASGSTPIASFSTTNSALPVGVAAGHYENNTAASFFLCAKSRGSAVNDYTIAASGDPFARFLGAYADGVVMRVAAEIRFSVDATPGSGDVPSRIDFYTCPDGSATTAIRYTINNDGQSIWQPGSTTPATLSTNGQFTLTPTSNTNFRISYRGSDGTTRVGNITLA